MQLRQRLVLALSLSVGRHTIQLFALEISKHIAVRHIPQCRNSTQGPCSVPILNDAYVHCSRANLIRAPPKSITPLFCGVILNLLNLHQI